MNKTYYYRSHSVDWRMLARDLRQACRDRRTTAAAAAGVMGICPTQLSSMQHGRPLGADALASLIAWLYPDVELPRWIRVGTTERWDSER